MGGFRLYQSPHGPAVGSAPLAASQTFEIFDPVRLVSNQLATAPKDGSVVLDDEFIGFAATGARGILANSRTSGTGALEIASPKFFGDVGAAANTIREYIRPTQGLLMATQNYWTSAAGTAYASVGGTDLGAIHPIASAAAGQWGLCDIAMTAGAVVPNDVEVGARIVHVIDTDGNFFTAATADTLTTGTLDGPTIVFEIVNLQVLDQVSGG